VGRHVVDGMNGTGMNMSGMIGACVAMMERISH